MDNYLLRILETTDIHAYIENYDYYTGNSINKGLVYVKTVADEARQEAETEGRTVIHLDAGDLIQGSALGNYLVQSAYTPGETHGSGTWTPPGGEPTTEMPIYGALGVLGVDVSTLGNHEFNFGLDYLDSSLADLPEGLEVVNANVYVDNGSGEAGDHYFAPYTLLDLEVRNGAGETQTVRIGVVGFVTDGIMGWDKKHLEGNVVTERVQDTAEKLVPILRGQGADLIFGITHTDHDLLGTPYAHDSTIAVAQVDTDNDGKPDYDALFGGHEHQVKGNAENPPPDLNGVPFIMSGSWGDTLGIMDLDLDFDPVNDRWSVDTYEIHFRDIVSGVQAGNIQADQTLRDYIDPWHNGAIEFMEQPVAEISHDMTSYFAHGFDDPLLQTFAEIQIDYGLEYISSEDSIFTEDYPVLSVATGYKGGREGGADYTEINAPILKNKDIASLYIYDNNTIAIVQLSGAELEDYLEFTAMQTYNTIDPDSEEPQVLNKVPAVSRGYNIDFIKGMGDSLTYEIDVTKDSEFNPDGSKNGTEGNIINLTYNDAPIADDDQFYVVMNNYRATGGGSFPVDWEAKETAGKLYLGPDSNQSIFASYFESTSEIVNTGLPNGEPTFRPVAGELGTTVLYTTSNNQSVIDTYSQSDWINASYVGAAEDINGKTGFANYQLDLPAAATSPEMVDSLRFMTFNSALSDRRTEEGQLIDILSAPGYELAANNAAIIQYLRPDVLVLQEFDYDPDGIGVQLFQENYLGVAQSKDGFDLQPIEYEFVYIPKTNTGELAPVDLNGDGAINLPNDAFGFGNFPGQYGMVVLSQYEIDYENIRTFQEFLWKDLPGGYLLSNEGAEETIPLTDYFSDEAIEVLRLSSKNHIDVPILVGGETIHVLASHPTPPVFDGAEKRNLKRNNDEIRLWADYIQGGDAASYIYDDAGNVGGLETDAKFVIMGDQNADPIDGDSDKGDPSQGRGAINQILTQPNVNLAATPFGAGGVETAYGKKDSDPRTFNQFGDPGHDTALFGLRVDYALPSANLALERLGVFYPDSQDPQGREVFLPAGSFETENANGGFEFKTSDHRAVYVDVNLAPNGADVFKVNLFHQSDQEGFAAAPGDANRNKAVMNRLLSLNDNPSLFVNSGDLWIAGLYLDASNALFGLNGSGQVMINNYLNWQTATWGNHEFDIPTDEVAAALQADENLWIGLNNRFTVVDGVTSSATGRTDNAFTLGEEGEPGVLRIHGNVADLGSPLLNQDGQTAIALYNAADGAEVASLEVNATADGLNAYFVGEVELSAALQTALENGDLYVGAHTEANPAGEVKSVLNLNQTYPGTAFPYISGNMDFSADPYLGPLQIDGFQNAQGLGNQTTTEPLYLTAGGQTFAVVGATTPTMPSLASNSVANGGVVTPADWQANEEGYDQLAALIQAQVDAAIAGQDGIAGTADDVNKVIVATHMQRINIDIEELAPRLQNVDVYIAGGSNTIFQNPANPLYPGDSYQIEYYPLLLQGADGNPTAVVNTDMNHEYLGYLQLEFNAEGLIINDFNGDGQYNFGTDLDFDIAVSRAYPGDPSQVEALNAENLFDPRIDNLATALGNQMNDKDSRWFGVSEEFLNGQRLGGGLDGVRNQETNLSNLIHDSYLWYASFWDEDVVISMSNGSGIRASIGQILPDGARTPNDANDAVGKPQGGISQADVESALAFNNGLALIDITGQELKTALESIGNLGNGDGDNGAYQIGGFAYSFDPARPQGERVRNARFLKEDGSLGDFIIQDGEVVTGAQVFRMATLGFNASRIFSFIENQNRLNLDPDDPQNSTGGVVAEKPADLPNNASVFRDGSQQDSLAEYLYQFSRNGTEETDDDVPLGSADTTREGDERVQILSYRADSLTENTSGPREPISGTPEDDLFIATVTDGYAGAGDLLFAGAGNDEVDNGDYGPGIGDNRVFLGSGADEIFVANGDRVNGDSGADIFDASAVSGYRLSGGEGDDLFLLGADGRALGGAGDDRFFVGTGGDNLLAGGAGADQFWLLTDEIPALPNIVTDFTQGVDVIGIMNQGAGVNFANLSFSGNDIKFNGDVFATLSGFNPAALTTADFVFA